MKTVASNLRKLRTARGMTQDELAETLHVVRQTVSSWENGKREPDIETLIAIAEALNADVTELIYGPKPAGSGEKEARVRRAIVFACLFAGFILLSVLWEPLLRLLGLENDIELTYDLLSFRNQLSIYCGTFIPILMWVFGGMALVFSVGVFRNLTIKQRWLRLLLTVAAALILGQYVLFFIFSFTASGILQDIFVPYWYYRYIFLMLQNRTLFFLPGLMLGFGLNR